MRKKESLATQKKLETKNNLLKTTTTADAVANNKNDNNLDHFINTLIKFFESSEGEEIQIAQHGSVVKLSYGSV